MFVFVIIILVHLPNNAEAKNQPTLKYKILAIEYSEGCQTTITHHINSTCPNLSKMIKYDTSNKNISGKFNITNGEITREKPEVKNHFMFYNFLKNTTVCVDCSLNGINGPDMIQIIFIGPTDFTYIDKDQTLKNTNNFITHNHVYIS